MSVSNLWTLDPSRSRDIWSPSRSRSHNSRTRATKDLRSRTASSVSGRLRDGRHTPPAWGRPLKLKLCLRQAHAPVNPLSGGRTWWAHFEFTRINITPIILPKKIEDLRQLGAFHSGREVQSDPPKEVSVAVGRHYAVSRD